MGVLGKITSYLTTFLLFYVIIKILRGQGREIGKSVGEFGALSGLGLGTGLKSIGEGARAVFTSFVAPFESLAGVMERFAKIPYERPPERRPYPDYLHLQYPGLSLPDIVSPLPFPITLPNIMLPPKGKSTPQWSKKGVSYSEFTRFLGRDVTTARDNYISERPSELAFIQNELARL